MNQKEKNYITPKGHARLLEELNHLTRIERPEVTKTVAWAASNGDRSENADYIYGKKRLREIDKRTRFLSTRLDLAIVVDPEKIKSVKVQFGATVTIEDEDSGEVKTISIVGVDEINTEKNQLSWKSPLGSSLIGKEVGDTISVKIPTGTKSYEIIEIIYVKID
jgi:transcription elongation factor GreB